MSFVNKVALIIGASSGIGAKTALEFTKEGANVIIVGRNEDKLKDVASKCREKGKEPLVIKADILIDDDVKRIVTEAISKYSKIDILVNNAGIVRFGSILNGQLIEAFDELVKTNLRGIMNVTAHIAPHIIKTKGSIINISSASGQAVPKHGIFTPYAISKAGLDVFTKGAAVELAPHGVRVNSVSPGPVLTEVVEELKANMDDKTLKIFGQIKTALNRASLPTEVASMILYISSDCCVGVTGSNFVLDNGMLLT